MRDLYDILIAGLRAKDLIALVSIGAALVAFAAYASGVN